jgi:ankyrin repeat protein
MRCAGIHRPPPAVTPAAVGESATVGGVRIAALLIVAACSAPATPVATPISGTAPPAPAALRTDVNARDTSGWTALQHAAEDGKLDDIKALLAAGAAIDARSPTVYDGATAFEIALQFGQPEAAKLLLDRGASIAGATGTNALALAARDGDDELLDVLLARGIPVTGIRALSLAAKFGRARAIATLLRAGAPVNGTDADDHHYTPLIIACQDGQLDAARVLIDAGANIDALDDDHTNVLHWAVFAARPAEIHIYRDIGGPHDTVYGPHPTAPLVALLVARGVKLEVTDSNGNTALHEAAMMDARAAAEVLVKAGANRVAKNHDGKTPLDLARDRKNSVVDVLQRPRP